MRKPTKEKVGMRFNVRPEHADAVAELYREAGYEPMKVETRKDGLAVFIFATLPDDEMYALVTAVPAHYSALQARIVGKSFPFKP